VEWFVLTLNPFLFFTGSVKLYIKTIRVSDIQNFFFREAINGW